MSASAAPRSACRSAATCAAVGWKGRAARSGTATQPSRSSVRNALTAPLPPLVLWPPWPPSPPRHRRQRHRRQSLQRLHKGLSSCSRSRSVAAPSPARRCSRPTNPSSNLARLTLAAILTVAPLCNGRSETTFVTGERRADVGATASAGLRTAPIGAARTRRRLRPTERATFLTKRRAARETRGRAQRQRRRGRQRTALRASPRVAT
eukprot:6204195-Pleurochrysis_carterae.AAC.7